MRKSPTKIQPRTRGRPPTGKEPLIGLRMPKALIGEIEAWADRHDLTRSEAVRRLVEQSLVRKPKITEGHGDAKKKWNIDPVPKEDAENRYRIAKMRQSLSRTQTKFSAGGREKRRTRPVPSMPKLKCLQEAP
jgi:hypothetical protein